MGILSIIQIGIFNMDHLDFTNGPFYQNLKTEYDKIFGDCLHLGGAYENK